MGGRGSGKTRTGAESVHRVTSRVPRIALIAPTGSDIRDTMVEGVSGLLATAKPEEMPLWEPSKKRLTWPNGAQAQGFSGEEPDRLRGPQHGWAWVEEPAHIPLIEDVWNNLLFGLRLGKHPRIVATTTPIPTKWMKGLAKDPRTKVVRVSTYANLDNLADNFKAAILDKYEGTRLGRQELHGEIVEDVEGALWCIDNIRYADSIPPMDRIVVAIDPAGTANKRSDDTGIIVLGIAARCIYVLEDLTDKYSPSGWATAAVGAYERFSADAIVAEKNYGGDMVREVLDKNGAENARILLVNSRRGKALRAEPVVALYEKERVLHARGKLAELEDEQLTWVPGSGMPSPNRLDALVHGATELAKGISPGSIAVPTGAVMDQLRDAMRMAQTGRLVSAGGR
jgi:phage terminase large subunit-like protein